MRMIRVYGWLFLAIFLLPATLVAQNRRNAPAAKADTTARKDSTDRNARTASKGPKPYKDVITSKMKTQKGLFTVHQNDDKHFLEIPNHHLNKDFLLVNRIAKGAADVRAGTSGYAGDIISEMVVRFVKGPNDKIFLEKASFRERASDTLGMYQSVLNSSIQPLVYAFDVQAYNNDSTTTVIDLSPLVNSDNELLYFNSRGKRSLNLGSAVSDRSYVAAIHSYPENLNIRSVKTYNRTPPTSTGGTASAFSRTASLDPATFELNSSLIQLPDNLMRPRRYDDRVGYFSTSYVDYDANPQGVESIVYARRWRLEPKPQDVQKYLNGELVEPQKPIVFYIDPSTPRKWIPYLIQGVNDWQVAFEQAGFKNAIEGRIAPLLQEDSTWLLEDARYSAIVYKPSNIPNASGPNVQDPRTGEILESHINWYHNVMSLLRNWYMIQTAAVDPGARSLVFEDSLMGELIRFVSSHEVGHTLGLRHNFGSSSTVPVAKLRDKKWVEEHGHTPSIMDYARFNYVAQPGDDISRVGLFPKINDYDKWAIEWGYKWFPETMSDDDIRKELHALTTSKLKNPRLWWGDGEAYRDDPRAQTEDLGDDPIMASNYGIANLKRMLPEINKWVFEEGETYTDLGEIYNQLTNQFGRYIGHVTGLVGGIERTAKTMDMEGPVYNFTSRAKQQAAMKWLSANVFETPTWVIDDKVVYSQNIAPQTVINELQNRALSSLMSSSTTQSLQRFEAEKNKDAYTLLQMMNDLRSSIFSELSSRKSIDIYRRTLQRNYVKRLIDIVNPPERPAASIVIGGASTTGSTAQTSDLAMVARAQLRQLQSQLEAANLPDNTSRIHAADLHDQIKLALSTNR